MCSGREKGTSASRRDMADPSSRILTVPNVLSAFRILLIPAFVLLLLNERTRVPGFLLLGAVVSTDWVDGYVARRTGQVTELGKVLDPVADRLAMAAALITFVALDAFPLWAALLVLARDGAVLAVGVWMAARGLPRIDVRPIGKYATFTLMWGIPMVAWGNLGLLGDDAMRVMGWVWFGVGTVEYYAAAAAYAGDLRRAVASRR